MTIPLAPQAGVTKASSRALLTSRAQHKFALLRMRAVATGLLVLMTALFVFTRHVGGSFAPYLHAFAEAGMVGACADWFAVTAIFRRPFGLPIPHTAVVPENKKRLGAALGRFVEQNFLEPQVALRRLRAVDLATLAAHWLADRRNVQSLAGWAARIAPYVLSHLPRDVLARWASVAARKGLEAIPVAPLAARALSVLWAQGAAQEALDYAVDALERVLERNREIIVGAVRRRSSRWIPRFVDEIVADKLIAGLSQTLKEMRTPGHPWRAEVEARIGELIDRLANDPAMRARGEALKHELFASPVFVKQLESLGAELETALTREDAGRAQAFAAATHNAASALARWLEEDPARRARLNRTLRLWALRAVLPRRAEIGVYIADVVERWNTATLVERLELQVGRDLQFIRINGTLVGGLVGLLIYAVSERAF